MDRRPDVLGHKVFSKIFEASELLGMNEATRLKVIHKMTTERDLRNQMRYAMETATAEGLAKGHAEGQKVKAVEIAGKLLATGMPRKEIADITGLSEADLENI